MAQHRGKPLANHPSARVDLASQFQPFPAYFPLRTPYFARMDHDAAHKYIYSLPEVTADLLRLIIPGWVDELDLSTLEDRSSEHLDAAHRKRLGDMAWRVVFRRGRRRDGGSPHVLVLVEFQSEVDGRMAKRMREYAEMLRDRAARAGPAKQADGLPWVLPIVVYNGSEPWTAAGRATDLAPLPSDAAAQDLALFQPQAYHLLAAGGALTSGARPAQDWPLGNRVSATVRLQAAGTPQELPPRLLEEAARFPAPANEAFRRALHSWARALWEHKTGGSGFPAFEELERTKGAVMATVAEAAWDRWDAKVRAEAFAQGVEQGIEKGIERGIERGTRRGGARLISRQAALKFGAGTAERLAGLLEDLTEQEDLDKVGGWILECGSADELLSRVSGLLAHRQG